MSTDYLNPVLHTPNLVYGINQWGNKIQIYSTNKPLPTLDKIQLAIIGVEEDRSAERGCMLAPNAVRDQLYQLYFWWSGLQIVDLGNIKAGETSKDTYFAVQSVVAELLQLGIIPIIIGGTHDISYGQFGGHALAEKETQLVVIDEKIDLFSSSLDYETQNQSFLYRLITQKSTLSHFTQVGFQRHLVDPYLVESIEKLGFDAYSVGELRNKLPDLEPIVRDVQMVSVDMSAARLADAPGVSHASPNGFSGEDLCQLTRYVGLSDHVRSLGIYEYNPLLDRQAQTASLVAQMVWYFVDGYYERKHDFPQHDERNYIPYIVNFKDNDYELVFLKSKKSDRWWVRVPIGSAKQNTYKLLPCTYRDYETACRDEVPDRWLRAYWRWNR